MPQVSSAYLLKGVSSKVEIGCNDDRCILNEFCLGAGGVSRDSLSFQRQMSVLVSFSATAGALSH